jgi:glycosyltransferase involved in cell wall biosynthesis
MSKLRVSCLIPAKNEAGRLMKTVQEALSSGLVDEIIIIEGGSKDDTWKIAQRIEEEFHNVVALKQENTGKFDAVRKGFEYSKGEYIVIWDADGTVRTYDTVNLISQAIKNNRTAIGNRLKGMRQKGSMRKANYIGNWAFALLWAFFLNGRAIDLLCGSKVCRRLDFERVPDWIKDKDPYGDFSLIAASIVGKHPPISIPVDYCFFWILKSRLQGLYERV